MSIKQKDIKLLWGRAAERCSFPGCGLKLSQDKNATTETFPLGEQAHIVGKEEGSARSHSILTVEERDSYYNTILLCPTHHTLIDNNPEDYPIEKLHLIKSQHEYWVESTLSESQNRNIKTNDIIYAHLVDLAVEGCSFSYWENWISSLYGPSHRIKQSTYDKAIDYTLKMYKAVWPGTLMELEAAMKTFSRTMNMMLNFYMNNAESKADYYIGDRSYKRQWHSEEVFAELAAKRDRWERYLDDLIIEVNKSANWLAEIVRRDINPLFMAIEGKCSLNFGPDDNLSFHTFVPEYSADEKEKLINSYEEYCDKLKKEADSIDI